jgi:methyltransferase of ATP-grasp peptide maturase system
MSGTRDSHRNAPCAAEMRSALVARLVAEGNLRSPAWIEAFSSVPRGAFVPSFFRERDHASGFDRIDREDSDAHDDWLRSVYNDDVLFTQINDEGVPISSSTSPGLMALMLEALDIAPGMKILEIGTGTGYNAALLCNRLGSAYVTSIDIDHELIDTARQRLNNLGYDPHLAAHDGMTGYKDNAPYARIISTVAVPSIPLAWLSQVSDGGRILANLYRELGGGALALLTVHEDRAQGRFLPDYGGFMPVRAIRQHTPISLLHAAEKDEYVERETQIASKLLDNPSFSFFAALLVPAQRLGYVPHDQPEQFWLLGTDGSWARQTSNENGQFVVRQHGPRMLWDALEQAHHDWTSLASPPRQDFGLTVTATGTRTLWHARTPNQSWELT